MHDPSKIRRIFVVGFLLVSLSIPGLALAGRIEGRVVRGDGRALAGVLVTLELLGRTEITDRHGRYTLVKVPAGLYELTLRGGRQSIVESVLVEDGRPAQVETIVEWDPVFFETATVTSVSRGRERIVQAPGAVTTLSPHEIEHLSSSGQLPKALEFTPGVELAQSDLYDFNLNTRGFNSMLNRRVLVLIDGRESSVPEFLGVQEWGSTSIALDEFSAVEFARGPGSALYGAGAVNGVLSFTTKAPRDSPGGHVRLSGGELHTRRVDFRHAGGLADGWYYKVWGGLLESGHYTESRVGGVEYAPGQLPQELIAPPWDRVKTSSGGLRLDGYFGPLEDRALTLEAGIGEFRGGTTIAPLGRTQAHRVERPWGRINFNTPRLNAMGYFSGRDGDDQVGLGSGASLYSKGSNLGLELQGNSDFAAGRGRVVGGVAYGRQRIDSRNPEGIHGIFTDIETANRRALFGQIEFDFRTDLRGVFSGRWDSDTLHDPRFSPRVALVYSPSHRHTLRLTYNDAFQAATLVEMRVRTAVGPPQDLSAIETALSPTLGGVPLGFGSVPQLAVGNDDLEVERIRSVEVGYSAVLASALYLTINVYGNELEDFATGLLPQAGTSLGRLNPDFGPYEPPAELSPAARAAVLDELQASLPAGLLAMMSNDTDGSPIFAVLSIGNFGRADGRGLEFGLSTIFLDRWRLDFSFNLFDGDVRGAAPESPLVPNAPDRQLASGLTYSGERADASIRYRWVDEFDTASGIYVGTVRSFGLADLTASYALSDRWGVGLEVTNLFDNVHYEIFGGSLLRRRALVELDYSW